MSKLTLSFKGTVLKVFPILRGQMFIGHDPACHLHIDSLALAPRHARVDTKDQTSILVDLESEQGTFVNQKRIDKHLLEDGDIIRIGKHTLQYIFEEVADLSHVEDLHLSRPNISKLAVPVTHESEKAASHAPKNGWLQILNGQNLGRTLSLNRSMTNLGKPGVATAIITRRNGAYFLSHLEGKRPPSIDDEPIGDRSYELRDGNTIQIGNIKMQFYME
ncbi:MAG TPA: FHA domain-containing protein [Gammaproteobacteria bacterium]|nr:FHA domain-containing protein [Gammaproteobacteria bacterium]